MADVFLKKWWRFGWRLRPCTVTDTLQIGRFLFYYGRAVPPSSAAPQEEGA